MNTTTEEDLRSFIIENFCFGRETILHNDDSFLEKGLIDSTGMLELIAYLEQRYGIQLEADELIPENLDSITRLVKFVSHKIGYTTSECRSESRLNQNNSEPE